MKASRFGNSEETPSNCDVIEAVMKALAIVLEPGQVTELRALGVSHLNYRQPHTEAGYFDNTRMMARAAAAIHSAIGIYFIPNPINPALLARAMNRVRPIGKGDPLTSDSDVVSRRWLLIDVDPLRPSGISSSEVEHQAALTRVRDIRDALAEVGWPEPILGDSGNGGHALYRVDLKTNDDGLIPRVLEALAFRFDNPQVTIDCKVFNPARIWKLYGTMARKGDDTDVRPHRVSRILQVPDTLAVVPKQLLEELAGSQRSSTSNGFWQNKSQRRPFDLERWITDYGLDVRGPEPWQGGRRWVFPVCPWNPDHRNGSAYIVQLESGAISAGCHHNGCKGRDWDDLRHMYEPESRKRLDSRESDRGGSTNKTGGTEGSGNIKPEIMVPGEHVGVRVGHDELAQALTAHLPLGFSLFRRGTELVRLVGDRGRLYFHPLNPDSLRGLVDQHVELIRIKAAKKGETIKEYLPCSRDLAGAVLAGLSCDPAVPECDTLTAFPAWVRTKSGVWRLPRAGYDSDARHFFDAPHELLDFCPRILDPCDPTDRKSVCDLIAPDARGPFQHFPWANRASAINVLAAVLTILMRPGIRSPVPVMVLTAPLPRTGKGLLVDTIYRIPTGTGVVVHPMPRNEEEISKILLSSLRRGVQVILFDNAEPGRTVCSSALAAFVTSTEYGGRLLGHSIDVSYPNRAILFLTGNNLALSRELALRSLPVQLLPASANPEFRTGLPNLPELIARDRRSLLSLLHGMIQAWVLLGAPAGHVDGLGGFEDWGATVGGVLSLWGFADQLGSNLSTWRADTDTETGDVSRFLLAWQQDGGERRDWSARQLLSLAQRNDLFLEVFARKEHGQLVAFSKAVVKPLVDVPREILDEKGILRTFRVIRKGSETSHRGFQYRLAVR